MDKNTTNGGKKHYKRGYMAIKKQNGKLGHCPKCGSETPCQPIKKREFEKMLRAMWKVPPPKN